MKIKDGFITHMVDEEQFLVGTGRTGFSGLVRSNRTAAFIVDQLKEETTKEEVLQNILEHYDATEEQAEQDLEKVIDVLRKIGALDE